MPSSRAFYFYWASKDIAGLGNGILFVAIVTLGYQVEESATIASILVVAMLLPPFILTPLADRFVYGRRAYPTALIASLAFIAALLPLTAVATTAQLRLVLTATFAAAIPAAFLKSARKAMLPALVDDGLDKYQKSTGDTPESPGLPQGRTTTCLAAAEEALNTTRLITLIAGPAAGSYLYGAANFGAAGFSTCAIAAIIALSVSALLLIFSRPSPAAWHPFKPQPLAVKLAELQKGLVYTWQLPALRTVATIQLAAALLVGGVVVVQVALMVWAVFTTAENLGLVLAAQGLGLAIATLGNRFIRNCALDDTRIAIGLGLIAAGGFSFAVSTSLNGAIASGLAIGLGFGISDLTISSIIRKFPPEEMAEPVWKGLDFARNGAMILSATCLGRMADLIGPRYSIVLISILLAVLALFSFGTMPNQDTQNGCNGRIRLHAERSLVSRLIQEGYSEHIKEG